MSLFLLQGTRAPRYFFKMLTRAAIFLLVWGALGLGFNSLVFADGTPWEEVKTLSDSGRFDEAIARLKANPSESFEYYYNLGTLSLRSGLPGPAVAYLEKASKLKASDPDARQNLETAKAALRQTIGAQQLDPAADLIDEIGEQVGDPRVRSAIAVISLLLIVIAFLEFRKSGSAAFRTTSGWLGALGLFVLLFTAFAQRAAHSYPTAVFVERQIIRSGPGDQFVELSRAEAGIRIRILDRKDGWYQIRFSTDGIGWVQSSSVLPL